MLKQACFHTYATAAPTEQEFIAKRVAVFFTQGFVGIKYEGATPQAADQAFKNTTFVKFKKKNYLPPTYFPSSTT